MISKNLILTVVLLLEFVALAQYRKSDHFDGKKFFNPVPVSAKNFGDVLKWQMNNDRKKWPNKVENRATPSPHAASGPGEVVATFINHATYLFQFEKTNLLVDPVFSERASPVSFAGPHRVRRPGLDMKDLPPIHVVLVTHNHYDHMDIASLKKLSQRFNCRFITPLGNKKTMAAAGVQNIEELDWWQAVNFGEIKITLTPAQHWSARGLFDKFEALWGGFWIENSQLKVFWVGDSGYGPHFKEIQKKLGSPDFAFLPIGAYEPRWFMKDMHMNPDDAVKAHLDLRPQESWGMHFGTFQLTDEAFEAPVLDLEAAKKEKGVQNFSVMEVGETRELQR